MIKDFPSEQKLNTEIGNEFKTIKKQEKKLIFLKGIKAVYSTLKSGIFSLSSGNHSERKEELKQWKWCERSDDYYLYMSTESKNLQI